MKLLLVSSGIALLYCILSALGYEILAGLGVEKAPVISFIVEGWISQHKLWASIITAAIMGFIFWLFIHWWFGLKATV